MRRTLAVGPAGAVVRMALCAGLFFGCSSPPAPPPPPGPLENLTEQTWLVRETVLTLRGLTDLAAGRHPAKARPPAVLVTEIPATAGAAFRVTVANEPPFDLRFKTSIQDPLVYANQAQEWLKGERRLGLVDQGLVPDSTARLLEASSESLYEAATEASDALRRAPFSAGAHEASAAVLGVVGLRENAAGHTDRRRLLTRVTAHLAMASLAPARPLPSDSATLAAFAHAWMAGRRGEAFALAERFTTSPSGRSWRNAAQLLSSEDWRGQTFGDLPTTMERLAYLRAFRSRVGTDRVHQFLTLLSEEENQRADWSRAMLTGYISVQTCNRLADTHPWAEIEEARRAVLLFRGVSIDLESPEDWKRLVTLLREEGSSYTVRSPRDPRALEVLPWPLLAASFQRHMGAAQSYALYCVQKMLYQPERVAGMLQEQEASFGSFPLFAIEAQRWANTPADAERFTTAAADLVKERPDLVSPHLWMRLLEPPVYRTSSPPIRNPYTWFKPADPFGLNLGDQARRRGPSAKRHADHDEWARIVALDPFDLNARWFVAWIEKHRNPEAVMLERVYGPPLAWSPRVMGGVVTADGQAPETSQRLAARRCEMEADFCITLAEIERDAGRLDTAERAYRRHWDHATDRVAASNSSGWLVERLRSTGRMEEAYRVAEGSAAVYSGRGLETLAKLQEATGRLRPSLETWTKMAERYDHDEEVYLFLKRQVEAGRIEFTRELKKSEATIFPRGRVKAVPMTTAPAEGLILSNLDRIATGQGFKDRDILVAINGIALASREQWRVVLIEAKEPNVTVRLYRGSQYVEITPRFEERKLKAVLTPYPFKNEG